MQSANQGKIKFIVNEKNKLPINSPCENFITMKNIILVPNFIAVSHILIFRI